ncbi:cytochrome P450 [Hypoxylon sp. FL1150]|nr:cytochrome P450 [Hypoxylon sp. FL1150]
MSITYRSGRTVCDTMEVNSSMAASGFQLQEVALCAFLWVWLRLSTNYQDILLAITAFISFRYAWVVFRYRLARRRFHNCDQVVDQVPPTYPYIIPFLGNAITITWDTALFTRLATYYKGKSTSTRVSMLGSAVYFIQDRSAVLKLIQLSDSPTPFAIRFISPAKALFGLLEDCGLDTYRISRLHFEDFIQTFLGPGQESTTLRFLKSIKTRLGRLIPDTHEWGDLDDLFVFTSRVVSASVIETIFGPTPLRLHSDFVTNLWEYDNGVPWLLRMVPRWLYPQPHRARERVLEQIQAWSRYAHQGSVDMMENGKQNDKAISTHDLGWIWEAATNPASAAALAILHIYSDPELLIRVRAELKEQIPHSSPSEWLDSKQLKNLPLLSSIYAETMRLYSNAYLMVASPPNTDVSLGKWKFPRRSLGLVSSSLAHTDDNFWNTKDDLYPIDTFWADRFLVYPNDPTSGPIKPEIRAAMTNERPRKERVENGNKGAPYFSTNDLEGSYMPFGAGSDKCPGRFLAKDVIMVACALLVGEYDVEILAEPLKYNIDMDPWRFGLGIGQPKFRIAARIRRRR